MFNRKVVRAGNASLRNPRRDRHIVIRRDKRDVKTAMSR